MVIELRVVQFWSEIILVISNRTHTASSFDFEITRMISDQIALHLVQLPLLTSLTVHVKKKKKKKKPGAYSIKLRKTITMSNVNYTNKIHS